MNTRTAGWPAAPDRAGLGFARELDAAALERLRQLDPTGGNRLIARVFAAFETSVARLRPQLEAAQRNGDAAGIRLVAHTWKSSSTSIGALPLAQLCAEVEQLAREQRLDAATLRIGPLLDEAEAVLAMLRRWPESGA